MNLYIQVENNQPVNHPAFEDNLVQAFGSIPNQWEKFVRLERPVLTAYQLFESETPTYEKVGDVWTDVWSLRDMTDDEKAAKQQVVKESWAMRKQADNWSAWLFDESLCAFVPPIPRPDPVEGKDVRWCGSDNNWKEVPPRPVDEGQYEFDFFVWEWVTV